MVATTVLQVRVFVNGASEQRGGKRWGGKILDSPQDLQSFQVLHFLLLIGHSVCCNRADYVPELNATGHAFVFKHDFLTPSVQETRQLGVEFVRWS